MYIVNHFDETGHKQTGNAYKTFKAALNRYERLKEKYPHGKIVEITGTSRIIKEY